MSPEHAAGWVLRWARLYTRHLPPAVAERRLAELDADLHDHIAHARARGVGESRIALGIAGRMLRGLPADLTWRRSVRARRRPGPVARVAAVTAGVLLVPLVAMALTDEVRWGAGDFVLAAVLLGGAGLLLELSARAPARLRPRAAAVAVGVAAMVFGNADDAPGLVLFGCLLIGATAGSAVRAARRSR